MGLREIAYVFACFLQGNFDTHDGNPICQNEESHACRHGGASELWRAGIQLAKNETVKKVPFWHTLTWFDK